MKKSIKEIFKNNIYLLDLPEVKELITYCLDLEDINILKSQEHEYKTRHTDKLTELIRDINSGINYTLQEESEAIRFGEIPNVNFKESIINLGKYIKNFAKDNNFRL